MIQRAKGVILGCRCQNAKIICNEELYGLLVILLFQQYKNAHTCNKLHVVLVILGILLCKTPRGIQPAYKPIQTRVGSECIYFVHFDNDNLK